MAKLSCLFAVDQFFADYMQNLWVTHSKVTTSQDWTQIIGDPPPWLMAHAFGRCRQSDISTDPVYPPKTKGVMILFKIILAWDTSKYMSLMTLNKETYQTALLEASLFPQRVTFFLDSEVVQQKLLTDCSDLLADPCHLFKHSFPYETLVMCQEAVETP